MTLWSILWCDVRRSSYIFLEIIKQVQLRRFYKRQILTAVKNIFKLDVRFRARLVMQQFVRPSIRCPLLLRPIWQISLGAIVEMIYKLNWSYVKMASNHYQGKKRTEFAGIKKKETKHKKISPIKTTKKN